MNSQITSQPDDAPRDSLSVCARLRAAATAPVSIAPFVYFRILFGTVMLWEVWRYFEKGWIERYFIRPEFFFKYYGFEWVHPLPGPLMYVHFAVLGLLAVCITLGLYYRISATLFFFGFTYVFLLDQTNYLNHFYLVSLLSFLLICLPVHRAGSLDANRKPAISAQMTPAWMLWLLRFQLAIPYVYGGIAKINADWLRGEPIRMWLAERTDFPVIGGYFTQEWVVYLFSYGGLVFDLVIVPMLLCRRTRWIGVAWAAAFHLMNSQLFHIGIFPWLMLLATPVFLPPHWLQSVLRSLGILSSPHAGEGHAPVRTIHRGWIFAALLFAAVQMVVPFRHWLYPGDPSWNEEGHRFSWQMKLRTKKTRGNFVVFDRQSDQTWYANPRDFLTRRQAEKMPRRPDMILQFSHFLETVWQQAGYQDVEVRASIEASLNGRLYQPLIDPATDLSQQPRTLAHCDWIMPLKVPMRMGSRRALVTRSQPRAGAPLPEIAKELPHVVDE